MIKLFFLLCSILILSGCKDKQSAILKLSAQQWYDKGNLALSQKKGSDAVDAFEKVVQYYPYDTIAAEAQLALIKAHRLDGTHESAIANADAFLQIYPAHPKADEALFLKALSYFDQVTGEREETQAVRSLATFHELKLRNPEFQKELCARYQTILYNIIVSSVMQQAKAYTRRKAIFPAINKYTEALRYPKNNFSDEAIFRLMECFFSISLDNEALKCFKLLQKDTYWHKAATQLVQRYAPQAMSFEKKAPEQNTKESQKKNPQNKKKG